MTQSILPTNFYSAMSSWIARPQSCVNLRVKFVPVFYGICLATVFYGTYVLAKRVIACIHRPSGTVKKTYQAAENTLPPPSEPTPDRSSLSTAITPDRSEMPFSPLSALPPPPKPEGKPEWRTEAAVTLMKRNEIGNGYFNQLKAMMHVIPPGAFKDALQQTQSIGEIKMYNLTHRYIYMPNRAALQQIAFNYYAKYGILIREVVVDDFVNGVKQLIEEIEKKVEGPQFIGIIVSAGNYGHSLPLIFYFGKEDLATHSRVRQLLIADAVGWSLLVELVKCGLPRAQIYQSNKARQVDFFSCRIGAMQFLKRALLALRDYRGNDGLAGYLKMHGTMGDDDYAVDLPPEFDAAEQVTNKGGRLDALNSRDRYSRKEFKGKTPRTVQALREAHKEYVEFSYEVLLPEETLKGLLESGNLQSGNLPACVTVQENRLYIKTTKAVNTHLARKGEQLSIGQERLPCTTDK